MERLHCNLNVDVLYILHICRDRQNHIDSRKNVSRLTTSFVFFDQTIVIGTKNHFYYYHDTAADRLFAIILL